MAAGILKNKDFKRWLAAFLILTIFSTLFVTDVFAQSSTPDTGSQNKTIIFASEENQNTSLACPYTPYIPSENNCESILNSNNSSTLSIINGTVNADISKNNTTFGKVIRKSENGEIIVRSELYGNMNRSTFNELITFNISGPETYFGDYEYWMVSDVPAGTYTINYGPINGYVTPFSRTKTLNAGDSITFLGIYTLIGPYAFEQRDTKSENGEISVKTKLSWEPHSSIPYENKLFKISGPETYSDNLEGYETDWSKSDVPAGTYTINYGPIDGYVTPASETKTLEAGGDIITFSGIYTLKKRVGDTLDLGDGYILLIKQIDPEKNEVLMELQLNRSTIDEKRLTKNDIYEFSIRKHETIYVTPLNISQDIGGEYTEIYIYLDATAGLTPHNYLTVYSIPEGATIYIDGVYLGKTLKIGTDIPASDLNTHSVHLEMQGYDSWDGEYKFHSLNFPEEMTVFLNKTENSSFTSVGTEGISTPTKIVATPIDTDTTKTVPTPTETATSKSETTAIQTETGTTKIYTATNKTQAVATPTETATSKAKTSVTPIEMSTTKTEISQPKAETSSSTGGKKETPGFFWITSLIVLLLGYLILSSKR